MAKKTKSYSQVQATDALGQLGQHGTSAPEFVYWKIQRGLPPCAKS